VQRLLLTINECHPRQTMPAFNRPFLIGLAGETLAHVSLGGGIFGGEWFERYRTFLLPPSSKSLLFVREIQHFL
jgi:hypothetical protein